MESVTDTDAISYHCDYLCNCITPEEAVEHCTAYSEQGFCWIGKTLTIVDAEWITYDYETELVYPDFSFTSNTTGAAFLISYDPEEKKYRKERLCGGSYEQSLYA